MKHEEIVEATKRLKDISYYPPERRHDVAMQVIAAQQTMLDDQEKVILDLLWLADTNGVDVALKKVEAYRLKYYKNGQPNRAKGSGNDI